ncbi:MAG: Hpt domain-containing protein [Pseudomonadota bacterium]|nr:Hpt domain-containing protein [Pseudomonadota bacterium]
MGDNGPSVDDLFAELRVAYAASLPAQIDLLAACVGRGHTDPGARKEAIVRAHRLLGTAGTYGLPAVSDAAAVLERALEATPPSDADIDTALRTLQDAAARITASTTRS